MARYKGAKPAPALSRKPVSQSTSFGGTVDLKANPNPTEIQPTAIVAAPNGKDADEEKLRRILVEAHRLAGLAPGEWCIWIEGSAERLGISRADLEASVLDIIKANEKKAHAKAVEDRRIEKRAEQTQREARKKEEREQKRLDQEAERKAKAKLKEFATIQKLPTADRELRLSELAKRLAEDLEIIRDEFGDFVGADARADPGYVEPWGEPVKTEALLAELMAQLRRYVVIHDEGALAVTLWVMMAWLHAEIAVHSPILVLTSAEQDSGKTTSLGVLERLTPRPYSAVEMTGRSAYSPASRRPRPRSPRGVTKMTAHDSSTINQSRIVRRDLLFWAYAPDGHLLGAFGIRASAERAALESVATKLLAADARRQRRQQRRPSSSPPPPPQTTPRRYTLKDLGELYRRGLLQTRKEIKP